MAGEWSYLVTPAPTSSGASNETAVPIDRLAFKDLALDPATGDLVVPITLITGVDAIVQNMRIRLKFFLGEWFLDQRLGMPYIEQIFVAAPDIPLIDAIFRKAVRSVPGIADVTVFRSRFDSSARRYYVDQFESKLVDGTTLTLAPNPFIIEI